MYDYDRRSSSRVQWTETRTDYVVKGDYNALKGSLKKLKSQGWRWDPSRKEWTIPKDRLTARQKSNIQKALGVSEAPKKPNFDVLKDLEKAGLAYMTSDLNWNIPDVGVDLSGVGGQKKPGHWVIDPLRVDTEALAKLKGALERGLKERSRRDREAVEALDKLFRKGVNLDYGLLVTWSPPKLELKGKATYAIRDGLKALGFRFEQGVWRIDGRLFDPQNISRLQALLKEAEEAAQEIAEESRQRGKTPATPRQIEYLKALIRKHRDDWYDITDGIMGMDPPRDATIESMSREEVSSLIDTIKENERA